MLVNRRDDFTKSIVFQLSLIVLFFIAFNAQSQCGPYQGFEGVPPPSGLPQTGLTFTGTPSFISTTSFPQSARSGKYFLEQYKSTIQSLPSNPPSVVSPKINTPQTFSFYVMGYANVLPYTLSFSDDNKVTWTNIPNGATTLSTTLNPTPYTVSSAIVPPMNLTSWTLVTVTAAFPSSPYGYYFKVSDTRVSGSPGYIRLDDFSWTSSVSTDNNVVIASLNSGTNPLNTTPSNCNITVPATGVYHFYDVGGISDYYSDGQKNNVIFTPANPGDRIKITFNTLITDLGSDVIYVYDSNTIGTAQIAGSPFSGSIPPASYTSYFASDGSLALQFYSNGTYGVVNTMNVGFDISVECTAPICPLPSNVTVNAIGSTTTTLGWTGIVGAYEYAATLSNTPPSGAGTFTSSSTGVLTGLTPNTSYYGWVRAKCSATFYSNWVPSSSFTTLCASIPVPYIEDFTGWNYILPTCTSSNGGDWQTNLSNGNLLATVSGKMFFTKPIALSAATIYNLSYDYAALLGTANFDVYIGTVNDASIMIPANKLFTHTGISTSATNSFTFTRSTTAAYYIGFYLSSTSNPSTTQLNLDNIKVDCVTPIITATSTSICLPSTIITLTGSVAGGYKWATSAGTLYSDAAGTIPYIANTNTTTVYFKTNATATITVTSINGVCNKTATLNIVFKTTTWDGNSWNNGVPDSTTQAIFNGNYTSTGDLNACSVIVNSGAVLFKAGNSLIVQNTVTTSGGSLTFENNASLVQVNNVANSVGVYNGGNMGNITCQRDTTPMRLYDFTYWSTPVNPQTLVGLSPLTLSDKYSYFNASTSSWVGISSNSLMTPGQGYIIRAPQNFDPTLAQVFHASFSGVPNNGTITTPIAGPGNLNLIGNPYPSALNIDLFMASPLNTAIVDKTIYLWTHNTAVANNNYSNNDYAAYNYLGGTGTSAAPSGTTGGFNNNVPNGKIASGQSFFIKGLAAGNATFQNTMRVIGNNNQFFKNTNPKQSQNVDINRIWIDINNGLGGYKQTLIGYTQNATLGLDKGFDGEYFSFGSPISLYSLVDTNKLAIQGRPMPFDPSDEVPLGFNSAINGMVTINLYDFDGLFTDQDVYLKDKQLNTIVNLKQGAYSFATNAGTYNDRFVIVYKNSKRVINNSNFNENNIVLFKSNQDISIDAGTISMKKVRVYDVRGSLLFVKEEINNTKTNLNIGTTSQVLLIEITSEEGEIVTKKYIN